MKRFLCLLLPLSLLLSGCSIFGERLKEPVTFYYLRTDYQYFTEDGVIVSEKREASGHRNDLSYLMALYLMGPAGEESVSPLPRGTRFFSVKQSEEEVLIQLSDTTTTMTDLEFTLACACLSLTYLELTDAQNITISSGERAVTMNQDSLALYDSGTTSALEETS